LNRLIGESSGTVADLATFLPLAVRVLSVRRFDPTGVLAGSAFFALATATGLTKAPMIPVTLPDQCRNRGFLRSLHMGYNFSRIVGEGC
jgi:hypothetical protein